MFKSDTLICRMYLENISLQARDATFLVRKEDGEAIGRFSVFHRKIIDRKKGQGSQGEITNPPLEYFPRQIIMKQPKPEGH